jgi:hypothetical protein
MSTVDERGARLYEIMKAKLNKTFTRQKLLMVTGYENSDKFDRAMRRARDLAEADGLFLPCACPAAGWVYCVTDDPRSMIDPTIWIRRVAEGAAELAVRHEDYTRTLLPKLPRADRAYMKAYLEMQEKARELVQGAMALTKALVDMRRDARDTEDE